MKQKTVHRSLIGRSLCSLPACMDVTKIRSLFGCTLIFTASLTIFVIIVITCQPQQLTRTSSDSGRNDAREADSRLHRARSRYLKHGAKRPGAGASARAAGSRPHSLKHSPIFGLHQAFPFAGKASAVYEAGPKSTTAFHKAIRERADENGVIFLATVDSSFVAMALNLFLTSFEALNITNYVFVGTDDSVCGLLGAEHPVACVSYFSDRDGNLSSNWGSPNFRRKTHYKTKIVLDALRLKVTPVIVDLDIVFFRNPLPYLSCAACDIQIQSDVTEGNSGFYMARPTPAAIELHEKALMIGSHNPRLSNQKTLARTIDWMTRQRRIRVRTLNRKLFPCGSRFFEEQRIMFAGDASSQESVLVHNNWIVSREAKVYRFRETGLWQVDSGGYYTDPHRRYLAYDNPLDLGPRRTLPLESEALRSALAVGALLNRTVILPTFHCHGCKYAACNNSRRRCSLNTFYRIADFDRSFAGRYREHVFLDHPLVPDVVKRSLSDPVLVRTESSPEMFGRKSAALRTFSPGNGTSGATAAELISWFGTGPLSDFAVLRFHSMYGLFEDFEGIDDVLEASTASSSGDWRMEGGGLISMQRRFSLAFQPTDYRQLK